MAAKKSWKTLVLSLRVKAIKIMAIQISNMVKNIEMYFILLHNYATFNKNRPYLP